jgi:chromosome segregation ATPase
VDAANKQGQKSSGRRWGVIYTPLIRWAKDQEQHINAVERRNDRLKNELRSVRQRLTQAERERDRYKVERNSARHFCKKLARERDEAQAALARLVEGVEDVAQEIVTHKLGRYWERKLRALIARAKS